LLPGTPPRIYKNTINFDGLIKNYGDDPPTPFSFLNDKVWIDADAQLTCHLTQTNDNVNTIIVNNKHVNRHIREEVTGPRYCPSIGNR
jgi:tRNA uridine 5-carboxymethylaminomethyl modification enzyme